MNESFVSSARIGVFHRTYAEMCLSAYKDYFIVSKRLSSLPSPPPIDPDQLDTPFPFDPYRAERHALDRQEFCAGTASVVFSSMCFEAAIHDYAARHLGDEYEKSDLEKLDLVSKWVALPELIHGKKVRKDALPYEKLHSVVRTRNKLVHHKSRELPSTSEPSYQEQFKAIKKANDTLKAGMDDALPSLIYMALEVEHVLGLAGPASNPLWFLAEEHPNIEIPNGLSKFVKECQRRFHASWQRKNRKA